MVESDDEETAESWLIENASLLLNLDKHYPHIHSMTGFSFEEVHKFMAYMHAEVQQAELPRKRRHEGVSEVSDEQVEREDARAQQKCLNEEARIRRRPKMYPRNGSKLFNTKNFEMISKYFIHATFVFDPDFYCRMYMEDHDDADVIILDEAYEELRKILRDHLALLLPKIKLVALLDKELSHDPNGTKLITINGKLMDMTLGMFPFHGKKDFASMKMAEIISSLPDDYGPVPEYSDS